MEKAAKFEKVSFGQFAEGWKKYDPEASAETIREIYDNLKMPKRATARRRIPIGRSSMR